MRYGTQRDLDPEDLKERISRGLVDEGVSRRPI